MNAIFQRPAVSIAMFYNDRLPYGQEALAESVRSALQQDHADHGSLELIIVDDRGPNAALDFLPDNLKTNDAIKHCPGTFTCRAAAINAAISAATGEYLLLMHNTDAQITLKKSAVQTWLLAAIRNSSAGMISCDYELIDKDGQVKEVHLLNWHPGRLRDAADFGRANFFKLETLRSVGGANERYKAADLYDLRLKVSERGPCIHIANRYAGSLHTVAAPAAGHDVFAYLLVDKDAQIEAENAITEHLKRTGAYLAPGDHVQPVTYTDEEQDAFKGCVASVVIPVNNRPQFIGRAIESVQNQTVKQVEAIVVVNGGPDDPTCDAVRSYIKGGDKYNPDAPPVKLIVVDINNLGLCFNSGFAAAAGKYYVQLDSDDRLKPDAVEKLMAVYDSDPTIGMVIGSYEVWNLCEKTGQLERNNDIPVVTHDEWTADNGRNNLLRINGAGAPRSAHIKAIADVGWFGVNDDPSCRNYGEDYDLVLRMSERYTIGRVWDPIYEVIRHSGGTDHSIDQVTIDRNDDAKDHMRLEALKRRMELNRKK